MEIFIGIYLKVAAKGLNESGSFCLFVSYFEGKGAKKHTALIHAKVPAVLLITSGPLVQMLTQWKKQIRRITLILLRP